MAKYTFTAEAENGPVFFIHKNKARDGMDISSIKIAKYYKTPEEIKEWEQLMFDEVGLKVDGNALIAGGGSCCGSGGGQCDSD